MEDGTLPKTLACVPCKNGSQLVAIVGEVNMIIKIKWKQLLFVHLIKQLPGKLWKYAPTLENQEKTDRIIDIIDIMDLIDR